MRSTKTIFTAVLALLLLTICCLSAALAENTVDLISGVPTVQSYTEEAVDQNDLEQIIKCGLAAASAINQQPWYFAVVTNHDVMDQISSIPGGAPAGAPAVGPSGAPTGAPGAAPGGAPAGVPAGGPPAGAPGGGARASLGSTPAAIILYVNESTKSPDSHFDCGLACENMVIAANALGYATKIVSAPTMTLNGEHHDEICELLNVDKSYSAVAVLLIGHADADVVTSASAREDVSAKVSYIK